MRQKTILNIILDESRSMEAIAEATIKGLGGYLNILRKEDWSNYEVTVTCFNTDVRQPVKQVPLKDFKDVRKINYHPQEYTALYDAAAQTILKTKVEGTKYDKLRQKVITVIITDGDDNRSRSYNSKSLKKLIEEKEKEGNWTFVFMGANQDSYTAAEIFGINAGNVVNFDASDEGVEKSYQNLATATSNLSNSISMRATGVGDATFFSEKEKENIENAR